MNQPDLFNPPASEQLARQRAQDGIRRAAVHAGKRWVRLAVGYVQEYAAKHETFLAEDCREFAEADGLTCPPDSRAWGGVMRRALREGIIVRAGYAPACSSNGSPKCLWSLA